MKSVNVLFFQQKAEGSVHSDIKDTVEKLQPESIQSFCFKKIHWLLK